ncbi:ST3 beta-galactoside alpha-2,3-sialyltransferase 7 [Anguilla rostrata]|uniref:ST3 beta-galactoside alpha-2,3-sialyltransferase 7 n=1 Tax=Anguilla rostrata TaxID=7938 RepID=UPI0030D5B6EB
MRSIRTNRNCQDYIYELRGQTLSAMVALKLGVKDPEDNGLPVLARDTEQAAGINSKTESRKFFISRERNLWLSLILLLGCYSAVLFPAFLAKEQLVWDNGSAQNRDTVLLNRSAAFLSRACRLGWCGERLRATALCPRLPGVRAFLQEAHAPWTHPPPLGLQGSEDRADRALKVLPQTGPPPRFGGGACSRCVVVGSGGVLQGRGLGAHIDQYDIIIRMNNAPVYGFERDAGSRTTIRLMYPEGAPRSYREYRNTSLVVLVVFKGLDLDWLASVVSKERLDWWSKLWFWREVVDSIPLQPENFRILNPEIILQTGLALQAYTKQPRQTMPTLGTSAVVMALQLCDEVSLAGFGYDLTRPDAPLHYYESLHMDAMRSQVVHDISVEKLFLRELVMAQVVNDLTGAL